MEIDYKALFKWQQKSNAYYLRVCDPEKREADLEAKVERYDKAEEIAEKALEGSDG